MSAIETFLVVSNEAAADSDIVKDVYVCPSIEEVNDRLEDLTFSNLDVEANKIFHGVLLPARTIPTNFQGCTPYIIVKHPERDIPELSVLEHEAAFIKESSSPEKVETTITNILNEGSIFDNGAPLSTIDDVFIFFGKEIIPVLQITEGVVFNDEEYSDRITRMTNKFNES